MAKSLSLNAIKRTLAGRKVKQLRRQHVLPANLYGKNIKSQSIQINQLDFKKLFTEAGETSIVNLTIEGDTKAHPVLIANVQMDPLTDTPVHIDFRQVVMTEKIKASIPVALIGESPAVKEKSAVIITAIQELEVEALPGDLPSEIQVDISSLTDVNQSILLKDVKLDRSKITLTMPEDTTMVTSQAQVIEVEEPAAPAEGEVTEAVTPQSEAAAEAEAAAESDKEKKE